MPGHWGGSHSHGDTSKGPKNSPFSSGFQGARKTSTKTKTTTTTTNKGSDDKKVAYQTSTLGKTNAKKAAEIKAKNKIKQDMEDFANLKYKQPEGLAKYSPVNMLFHGTGLGKKTFETNKAYYEKNVIGKTNPATGKPYSANVEEFQSYIKGRTTGKLDAMGRTITTNNDGGGSNTGGRVVIEKKVGGSTILTETKTEAEKTAEAKQDEEYDARKTKRRGRRRTILTSQTGAGGNLVLGKPSLLGA